MDKITLTTVINPTTKEILPGQIDVEVVSLSGVSDGYHTIAELYDHRVTLYIALGREIAWHAEKHAGQCINPPVWRSKTHGDGKPAYEGWFIMGIGKEKGKQISYHLPLDRWEETNFAETLDKAPEWDGHTSADVLERLKGL